MSIIFGILLLLHGLVHLLYAGHSARLFELQPGMAWPDNSWAFGRLLGNERGRIIAVAACLLAALGFVAGGIALFASQTWWRPVTVAAAAFSAAIFILFWDGRRQALANKGVFAILINAGLLVVSLVTDWPRFES